MTLPTTISPCPSAETEVDPRWRTAFNLTEASDMRLQVQVATPCAGARLYLKASLDSGATWGYVSAGGTGPWVTVGTAGYQRGESLNVAPEYKADVLLSVFVSGGDDATALVLGNVGALLYQRSEDGGIVEIEELTGCAVPDALDEQYWGNFATMDDWYDYINNDQSSWQVWYSMNSSIYGEFTFDEVNTFNGSHAMRLEQWWAGYVQSSYNDFSGAPDVTHMARYKLDTWTASGGSFSFFLFIFYHNGNDEIELSLTHDGRAKLRYQLTTAPKTYATIDIGPASDFCGQDRELIARVRTISAAVIQLDIYLHAPCETPVLYHTESIVNVYAGTVITDMDRYYAGGLGTPSDGVLLIYQEAVDTDPTVFGLSP